MNIILVNLSKNWGGGEKWFLTVGKKLLEKGHQVTWLVFPESKLAHRLTTEKLPFEAMPLRFVSVFNSRKMRKLERWLKHQQADAILFNGSHELKAVGLAAWRTHIPTLVFRRGVSYALKQNFTNRWFIAHIPTHFLANSQATFEAFATAFPHVKQLKHTALNNGIDMQDWIDFPVDPTPKRIVMSARLSPEKGIDKALQAVKLLQKDHPELELHLLGEGKEKENLVKLSKQLGIDQQVVFHGFVQDIRPELAKAWLFLFTPSHGEGTSLALVEAMSMGIPCVAFNSPAMAEVIMEGETGFLVENGDVQALAQAIERLLNDNELRHQLGNHAKERAQRHFSLSVLAEKVEAFLLS